MDSGIGKLRWMVQAGRLIRWPNLLMVLFTMVLVRYAVILPLITDGNSSYLSPLVDFLLLVLATLLITAGGYVINDYFDVKIDRVNRPDSLTIYRWITPQRAIKINLILNAIAILIGFYLAWRIRTYSFAFIFPLVTGLLWAYSARYKKALFWGNLLVSALSAFVIMLVWLFEFFWLHRNPMIFANAIPDFNHVTWILLGYSLFALLVTMIREIIKDAEDIEGDLKFDCRTIPIVLGLRTTGIVLAVLTVIAMLLLGYVMVILLRLDMMMLFVYFAVSVQVPSIYLLFRIFRAGGKEDYNQLSALTKLIMVAGILSMEILFISLL